jgi:hypothetical protein
MVAREIIVPTCFPPNRTEVFVTVTYWYHGTSQARRPLLPSRSQQT